jgi:hypothetical protein
MPTRSYLSQSERTVTFGLGDGATIKHVEITWPNGASQNLTDLPVDRLHIVTHPGAP